MQSFEEQNKVCRRYIYVKFYQNGCRYDIIVRGRDYSVDLTLSASFDRLPLSLPLFHIKARTPLSPY